MRDLDIIQCMEYFNNYIKDIKAFAPIGTTNSQIIEVLEEEVKKSAGIKPEARIQDIALVLNLVQSAEAGSIVVRVVKTLKAKSKGIL